MEDENALVLSPSPSLIIAPPLAPNLIANLVGKWRKIDPSSSLIGNKLLGAGRLYFLIDN